MKTVWIIGSLGVALAAASPMWRALRRHRGMSASDREYFAAARKRAIEYRLSALDAKRAKAG